MVLTIISITKSSFLYNLAMFRKPKACFRILCPPLPLFFPILLFFLFLHLITKYSPPTDVSDSVWRVAILSYLNSLGLDLFMSLSLIFPLLLLFPILFLFLHLITKYSPPTDVSDSVWQVAILCYLNSLGLDLFMSFSFIFPLLLLLPSPSSSPSSSSSSSSILSQNTVLLLMYQIPFGK